MPNFHQLKTAVKLHVDQMMRTRNFRRSCGKGDQSPKVTKETKPALRGKWESVFSGRHMDNVPRELIVVSSHDLLASGHKGKGQRRKGRSSSPASHSKAKRTDGEEHKSSQGSGNKQENSRDKSEIPCRLKFCKNPSCGFWHPSVCLNNKSEKRLKHGDKCHFRHVEPDGKPNKKSKKGGAKGSVALLKESTQLGLCISRFLSEKIDST